jgi:site-specific recombinase XerC
LFLGTLKNPDGTVFEPTTRHTIVSGVRQFFRWAVKYKYLVHDISQNIENPKLKEQVPKSLSVEDALKMINLARNRKVPERDYLITLIFLIEEFLRNVILRTKLLFLLMKSMESA